MSADYDFQPNKGAIWLVIILVLIGFVSAVLYFNSKNPVPIAGNSQVLSGRLNNARQPRIYTVFYGLGVFSPTNLRIHIGDSVRFQNDSNVPIHVISDSTDNDLDLPGFDSVGDVPPKGVFTFTFSQAGIFGYHNT